jgi:predicted Rossmann fold nucleotide-binding protein DprA/Smf involved in DNA uptake
MSATGSTTNPVSGVKPGAGATRVVADPPIRHVREIVRDEHAMRPKILAALADGPLTIPQIASAIGRPTHEVVYWVMGLRKYGWIAEIKEVDDDGYFPYEAVAREES